MAVEEYIRDGIKDHLDVSSVLTALKGALGGEIRAHERKKDHFTMKRKWSIGATSGGIAISDEVAREDVVIWEEESIDGRKRMKVDEFELDQNPRRLVCRQRPTRCTK